MSVRTVNMPAKPFYLVRHGESHANGRGYPAGLMDSRLTRLGRDQTRATARMIAGLQQKPDVIISSTMIRARHTAEAIRHLTPLPMKMDRLLSEQFYGLYQGVNRQKVHAESGPEWWRAPKGGEDFNRFTARVTGRIAHWLNRVAGIPMFVGHNGIFTAFGELYGNPMRNIPNAGAFLFEPHVDHGKIVWSLYHFGDDGQERLYCRL